MLEQIAMTRRTDRVIEERPEDRREIEKRFEQDIRRISEDAGQRQIRDGRPVSFRLEGKHGDNSITLWIDKKSYVMRQFDQQATFDNFRTEETTTYEPVVDGEITDAMLEFDPPQQK